MTEEERYLFDLQGYLVLRGVLPHDFVSEINRAVDELESLSDDQVTVRGLSRIYRNAKDVLTLPGEPNGGLPDYDSQILPYGGFAEELIDWPTSLGYVQEMIGEPCRMDAASLMSRNTQGTPRPATPDMARTLRPEAASSAAVCSAIAFSSNASILLSARISGLSTRSWP